VSDTPRTDAQIFNPNSLEDSNYYNVDGSFVRSDFARQLERENAELRADKERLDWLSTENGCIWAHHESEQCNITRRAIDAARKAQP